MHYKVLLIYFSFKPLWFFFSQLVFFLVALLWLRCSLFSLFVARSSLFSLFVAFLRKEEKEDPMYKFIFLINIFFNLQVNKFNNTPPPSVFFLFFLAMWLSIPSHVISLVVIILIIVYYTWLLYIYLAHPHSKHQNNRFQSKQSKHFHQRN